MSQVEKKRAGVLLRVSTRGQAGDRGDEADIPTQRTACLRFIAEHPDWEFVKEYMEIGVSGYKTAMAERDQLLEVRDDIAAGVINLLVVFMFDRLGRIEEETPFVVKSFVDLGAEVWSVMEGQRKFDAHVDHLLNYLYFWQASGESRKTSERVSNAMTQMAEAGRFTGGRPPYGYSLVETGRTTKKKLPEKTLAIDETEAEVVRAIFDLAHQRGYGCHRIAAHLNESSIPARSGGQWGHATVAGILKNPVYKGVRAYGRSTGKGLGQGQRRLPQEQWILAPPNPDWVIVPEALWEQVQARRKRADPGGRAESPSPVKSGLLLAGMAFCGCCGAALRTGYTTYRWRTKDGALHRRNAPVYRCGSKDNGKTICTGKFAYGKDLVEGPVLELVSRYLDCLPSQDMTAEVRERRAQSRSRQRRELEKLERKRDQAVRQRQALEQEVVRAVSGESAFEQALLRKLLEQAEAEMLQVEQAIAHARSLPDEEAPAPATTAVIDRWSAVLDSAEHDERKMVLSHLIERVEVSPARIEVWLRVAAPK